ncbi:MAG TPA: hypothetical protein VLV81_06675 [Acidimicrobiia bacterium]|nr:hypothetical protein [Acidimicrobiia bacterium]
MRAFIRGGCIALTTTALVVSMAGVAVASPKPKKQSPAKYAKTVCGTYTQLENDIGTFATAIGGLDTTDVAGYKTGAAAPTTTLLASLKADEAKLAAAYPDISNGQKIGKLLVTNANELDKSLTQALATLQADPSVAGPGKFAGSVATLPTKLSDPFSKITDQTLINAFQKEKLCKNVVRVTGG